MLYLEKLQLYSTQENVNYTPTVGLCWLNNLAIDKPQLYFTPIYFVSSSLYFAVLNEPIV